MHRPRIRIILPTPSATPTQSSLTSPLHPLKSPLKSLAIFQPASTQNRHRPFSPIFSPCRYPPPQLQSPLAWTWRCHLCCTTYRLGITRRCLVDGHYFCSNPPPLVSPATPTPTPTPETSPESSSIFSSPSREKVTPPLQLAERGAYVPADAPAEEAVGEPGQVSGGKKKAKNGSRKSKQRKAPASCTSSFDYLGWADWNAWRRELGPMSNVRRPRVVGLVGLSSADKHQKDCFVDCDFPSECSWHRTSAYLESMMEGSPVVSL